MITASVPGTGSCIRPITTTGTERAARSSASGGSQVVTAMTPSTSRSSRRCSCRSMCAVSRLPWAITTPAPSVSAVASMPAMTSVWYGFPRSVGRTPNRVVARLRRP